MLKHTAIGRRRRKLPLRGTDDQNYVSPTKWGFPASAPNSRAFQGMVLIYASASLQNILQSRAETLPLRLLSEAAPPAASYTLFSLASRHNGSDPHPEQGFRRKMPSRRRRGPLRRVQADDDRLAACAVDTAYAQRVLDAGLSAVRHGVPERT